MWGCLGGKEWTVGNGYKKVDVGQRVRQQGRVVAVARWWWGYRKRSAHIGLFTAAVGLQLRILRYGFFTYCKPSG